MARANLSLDESLTKAWNEANENGNIRYLTLAVKNESVICTDVTSVDTTDSSSSSSSSSSTSWWTILIDHATTLLNEQQNNAKKNPLPPFASPGGSSSGITPLMWLVFTEPHQKSLSRVILISLTSDMCSPRMKMLYASARDDVKRNLGVSRFEQDFHVNEISELNLTNFNEWRNRDRNEAMSTQERVQAAVNKEMNKERSNAPRMIATMTKVPFKPDQDLVNVFTSEFIVQSTDTPTTVLSGWVEVQVNSGSLLSPANKSGSSSTSDSNSTSESLSLVKQGKDNDIESLANIIAGSQASPDPRFFLIAPHPPAKNVVMLVYHCPESAKPKSRMLYSTAKAAMTTAAIENGVLITKVVETRDKDDVLTALKDASTLTPVASSSSVSASSSVHSLVSPVKSQSSDDASLSSSTPSITSPVNRFGGIGLPGLSPGMAAMTLKSTPTDNNNPPSATNDEFGSRPSRPGRGGTRLPGMMALPGLTGGSSLFGDNGSTTEENK